MLNPHYKGMGGLSEYWTYILSKRVGANLARQLTDQCLPISVHQARHMGLIDDVIIQDNNGVNNFRQFEEQVRRIAARFAAEEAVAGLTKLKRAIRAADEERKPLARYRCEELDEMRRNFWGADPSYHVARSAFVRKRPLEPLLRIDQASDGTRAGGDAALRTVKGSRMRRPVGRARSETPPCRIDRLASKRLTGFPSCRDAECCRSDGIRNGTGAESRVARER